jgi:hypothetical protein
LQAASGGTQALLVPLSPGGFAIMIDPDATPGPQQQADAVVLHDIRVAHELGHTFFYSPGSPPSRRRPPDIAEERFCDEFAAVLLEHRDLPATQIRRLLRGGA